MTYNKVILAAGALTATTTAVRDTRTPVDLVKDIYTFTGTPADIMLAILGIPSITEDYFKGEAGLIPITDDMSEAEK